MVDDKRAQLEAVLEVCRHLEAEVRYQPKYGHFTVMVLENSADPANERQAHIIQRTVQEKSAMYPRLVCFCFDPFSTMVYAI